MGAENQVKAFGEYLDPPDRPAQRLAGREADTIWCLAWLYDGFALPPEAMQ